MDESEFTDDVRPLWAPRVQREKVRRLYELDARGLIDESLIDDVGIALLLRCRSILTATEAHAGRAKCPRCSEIIPHGGRKHERMACPGCGWQTTWGAYLKTYQDKQLHGGGALFAFEAYAETYPRARTPRERLLLIDRLLHVYHSELAQQYNRSAASNLIGGNWREVLTFLDELTYGEKTQPEISRQYAEWHNKTENAGKWIREALELSRARGRRRDGD